MLRCFPGALGNRQNLRALNCIAILVGGMPMRDWFLPLAPVAVVTYFIAYPTHLSVIPKALAWMHRLVH